MSIYNKSTNLNPINNLGGKRYIDRNSDLNIYFKKLFNDIKRDKYLYLLTLPGILFFIIFKYIPIGGVIMAFQNYSPVLGFTQSKWVGFENFHRLFTGPDFLRMFRNTMAISSINLVLFFPLPIIISLMLNEMNNEKFKKVIQSIIYIPHFLSWVIIYALTYLLFSQGSGIINQIIAGVGFQKIDVMTNSSVYWITLAFQNIWKDTGWGTIVFLAAIAGIDPQMYEAARLDGAGKLRQIWNITIPSISNIIIIMLILRLGSIMDVGFEQIFLMYNGAVSGVSDVFDLLAYRYGITQGQFSFSIAIGLFKSVIGFILVVTTNKIANRLGHQGVF